jgi:hypothetical protein
MEWISVKDRKPATDLVAYVCNVNFGYACWVALYSTYNDTFQLSSPSLSTNPPMEITHWIELPIPPVKPLK